jgi:hypothetical protein
MEDEELVSGRPVPKDYAHTKINPKTGLQQDYIVLTPEERAKGFVKPVRRSYVHTGRLVCGHELEPYADSEHYGAGAVRICHGPVAHPGEHGFAGGHTVFIATAAELDRLKRTGRYKGCGVLTTMALAIAETYARKPGFYGGTFCTHCRAHFPLNEFEWEPDGEPMDIHMQETWAADQARIKSNRETLARAQLDMKERAEFWRLAKKHFPDKVGDIMELVIVERRPKDG